MVVIHLIYWRNSILFPYWLQHFIFLSIYSFTPQASPTPVSDFLMPVTLTGVERYLVVLICISLIASDIELLLMYQSAISLPFWKNVYFRSFSTFNWIMCGLFYSVLVCMSFLHILAINCQFDNDLQILFPILVLLFLLFCRRCWFDEVPFVYFFFYCL